ncbi:S41 family peptidase [Streptomyces candidus]|uniref:C-terminal processing protease CtpA/Prc n=1 Tax=Streptomyces candidus TaxID=67283 RepID=A0A7X0HKD8_9ACTN|nr:S41 family peptidase [Streptomyces candidus]MBB6439284.1 C-terminal processing protease CtpA/Prc [Streptomyces candidus]GHH44754.1 peptidase [Streptomyces candidus]
MPISTDDTASTASTEHTGATDSGERQRYGQLRRRAAGTVVLVSALALVAPGLVAYDAQPVQRGSRGGVTALEGVWRSDGYQQYLTVRRGELRSYEVSAAGCLPGGLRLSAGRAGIDGAVPFNDADDVRELSIRTVGGAADRARLSPAGAVGERRLARVSSLPAGCALPPADSPLHTFDVFWSTLRENYPFFRDRGVDWNAMRAKYRPQVHPRITDDRLFALLAAMIEPLHDLHTQLRDPTGERGTLNLRPGTPKVSRESVAAIESATRAQLPATVHSFANGRIQYADLEQRRGVGYLRITSFLKYGSDGKENADADAAVLDRALDTVFTASRIRDLRGLVVDLRYHGGGSDALGIAVARRLTDRTYTAYTKSARNSPHNEAGWTPGQHVRVRPAAKPRYTGPVAVLTGPLTVSAGETFTQALMSRSPAPLRIGKPTQGVFSDTMNRALPNGWTLTLPNEKYADRTGRTYDGAGIPPTHHETVYAPQDLHHLRDPALKRALRELDAR